MSTITRSARGTLWSYRNLIGNFARRDLKARFRGTVLGWLWSLVQPLATVLIYTVVFSLVFRATPPPLGNGEPGPYAVWLLAGIISYSLFSVGVGQGIAALLGAGTLLQKIYIPSYVPVFGAGLASSIQTLIEFGILAVILIILGNVGFTWLLFPALLVLFFIFVMAVTLILAILNVYLRDLQQITAVAIQLLFFLSPILYPVDLIPEEWNGIPVREIMMLNPLAEFIGAFRNMLYDLTVPALSQWVAMVLWTIAVSLLAWWVYLRKGQDIGEAI